MKEELLNYLNEVLNITNKENEELKNNIINLDKLKKDFMNIGIISAILAFFLIFFVAQIPLLSSIGITIVFELLCGGFSYMLYGITEADNMNIRERINNNNLEMDKLKKLIKEREEEIKKENIKTNSNMNNELYLEKENDIILENNIDQPKMKKLVYSDKV